MYKLYNEYQRTTKSLLLCDSSGYIKNNRTISSRYNEKRDLDVSMLAKEVCVKFAKPRIAHLRHSFVLFFA